MQPDLEDIGYIPLLLLPLEYPIGLLTILDNTEFFDLDHLSQVNSPLPLAYLYCGKGTS
jgi:hypothetical protein